MYYDFYSKYNQIYFLNLNLYFGSFLLQNCKLLHFAAGLSGPSVHITFALRRETPHFTYPTLRPAALCGVTERMSLRDIYP